MIKIFYQTISNNTEYEIPKIKWSRFIGNISHVKSKEDVDKVLAIVKNKYPDASHDCYAYKYDTKDHLDIFGNVVFSSKENKAFDDGEPTSTAGKPILNIIEKNQIFDVLLVVTRYFGWTKLWIGWLIQAYGECAKETIAKARKIKAEITSRFNFSLDFDLMPNIRNLLNKYEAKIITEKYNEDVELTIEINNGYSGEFKKELSNLSKGQISL